MLKIVQSGLTLALVFLIVRRTVSQTLMSQLRQRFNDRRPTAMPEEKSSAAVLMRYLTWDQWSWLILEIMACSLHTAPMLEYDISSQVMGIQIFYRSRYRDRERDTVDRKRP